MCMPMTRGCGYLGYTGTTTASATERNRPEREQSERGKSNRACESWYRPSRHHCSWKGRLASVKARSDPRMPGGTKFAVRDEGPRLVAGISSPDSPGAERAATSSSIPQHPEQCQWHAGQPMLRLKSRWRSQFSLISLHIPPLRSFRVIMLVSPTSKPEG